MASFSPVSAFGSLIRFCCAFAPFIVLHFLILSAIGGDTTGVGLVAADQCGSGAVLEAGNYYCSAVKGIQYNNVGSSGSYNAVTDMASDGTCTSKSVKFSGPLAPFDEEVSNTSSST